MQIGVVSLFPELVDNALNYGVVGRARENGQLRLHLDNPRDWTEDKHRSVDDRPFGGGPGMVMKPEPLQRAIRSIKEKVGVNSPVVCLSPQGSAFDQSMARRWCGIGQLVLVAGRYEGIDERVVESYVDEEVSLGDFILSGGEFAALIIIDAVTRLVPGVLGDPSSADEDSFGRSGLLDHPHYTRPVKHEGREVPPVLLSGDHAAIGHWRRQQALRRTMERRPDLLEQANLTAKEQEYLTSLGYRHPSAEDTKIKE
ncbi:MAG: tRNA (guanosine(37)-N1)-methyltransferase TrmD [Granulosicoccus sp.]|nr:tRNA (guanosine(37)-N1)-methyltransferase TrmD [Granulosicoccus sp.]